MKIKVKYKECCFSYLCNYFKTNIKQQFEIIIEVG